MYSKPKLELTYRSLEIFYRVYIIQMWYSYHPFPEKNFGRFHQNIPEQFLETIQASLRLRSVIDTYFKTKTKA